MARRGCPAVIAVPLTPKGRKSCSDVRYVEYRAGRYVLEGSAVPGYVRAADNAMTLAIWPRVTLLLGRK